MLFLRKFLLQTKSEIIEIIFSIIIPNIEKKKLNQNRSRNGREKSHSSFSRKNKNCCQCNCMHVINAYYAWYVLFICLQYIIGHFLENSELQHLMVLIVSIGFWQSVQIHRSVFTLLGLLSLFLWISTRRKKNKTLIS